MFKNAIMIALLAVIAVGGTFATAGAQDKTEATVEVRVWQALEDERDIYVSARPAGGSWRTLGTIPLPLDDGRSSSGRYRYGDIALDVPVAGRASPATVEVRVWQDLENSRNIHISARGAGGDWGALGTIPLPLDDGHSSDGRFRYGDIALDVELPNTLVSTLHLLRDVQLNPQSRQDVGMLHYGVEFDHDGSVVVADALRAVILRIQPDGSVTTIAGANGRGLRDGPADTAQFVQPRDVAIARDGSIYVADGRCIRRIAPDGMVSTRACGDFSDESNLTRPHSLVVDDLGDIYVLDAGRGRRGWVGRVSPAGVVSAVVERNMPGEFLYGDGPVAQASFYLTIAMDIDQEGNLYVLEEGWDRDTVFNVRVIDVERAEVSTLFEGKVPGAGGALVHPRGIALGSDGTIYLTNTYLHQVLALTPEGELTAVAGSGEQGYVEGTYDEAAFNRPAAIAVSDGGTVVVGDERNNSIRRILPVPENGDTTRPAAIRGVIPPYLPGVGDVEVFAGTRRVGPPFVDGPADQAKFLGPDQVALDSDGNLLVVDSGNDAIRMVSPDGTVTTLAGGNGEGSRDGPCSSAQFSHPLAIAVSDAGDIYVSDWLNYRIRRVSRDCQVTTVAGGTKGYRDGPADVARFSSPYALAFDREGNLLIVDTGNHAIRSLSPRGEVSTFAGGKEGRPFTYPQEIAVGDDGHVFVVQRQAVFAIDPVGDVTTILQLPTLGLLRNAGGIAVASDGALFVTEQRYGRVLRITRDGQVSIVAGGAAPGPYLGDVGGSPSETDLGAVRGIVFTQGGDLLVAAGGVDYVWRIPFEGDDDDGGGEQPPPPQGDPAVLAVGYWHTCALRESGEIACWGYNSSGQTDAPSGTFTSLSVGYEHSCGLRDSGEIACWGDNDHGQTDPPSGTFRSLSVSTVGSSLSDHTCALRESGEVACWGDNDYGQTDTPSGTFSEVKVGGLHNCALRDSGEIACWGWRYHYWGQADAPTGRFRSLSLGYVHTCALRESGEIACWGLNSESQTDAPAGTFRTLSAGWAHNCALRESGEVTCWGDNRWKRTRAPSGTFHSLSAGQDYTCALRESGEIACWGRNDRGQRSAPEGQYRSVIAGEWHSCALRESGEIACWGANPYGQTNAPSGTFRAP